MRGAVLYLALLALPAAGLAVLAVRLIRSERDTSLATLDRRLEDEAARLRAAVELRLEEAAGRADARIEAVLSRGPDEADNVSDTDDPPPAPVLFTGGPRGRAWRPPVARPDALDSDSEAARRAALSLRGGQAFEARDLWGRAFDAYTFYLAAIPPGAARAQLVTGAARSAERLGKHRLARALLGDIAREAVPFGADRLSHVGGYPAGVLAALALASGDGATEGDVERLRHTVRRRARHLATPRLAGLVRHLKRLGAPDAALARHVKARRALERALARRDEPTGPAAHFDSRALLLGRAVEHAGRALVAWTREEVPLPPAALGWEERDPPEGSPAVPGTGRGFAVRWDVASAPAEDPAGRTVPLRLRPGAPPVAALSVTDRRRAGDRAAILARARTGLAVVSAMGLVTLLGGAALVAGALRARRLARLRSSLVTNVSHELKTPVTSLRLLAEMLAEDPRDSGRVRHYAGLLETEARRLGRLVEDALDVSRLETGRAAAPARAPVDLAGAARTVAASTAVQARDLGAEVVVADEGPVTARGDPDAVERIAHALVENALAYGRDPDGAGGSVVKIECGRDGRTAWLRVADRGPGVPASERERIFDVFYRGAHAERTGRGAGLGLALARRLARAMGGDVELERRRGPGASFRLVLPVDDAAGPPPPEEAPAPPREEAVP